MQAVFDICSRIVSLNGKQNGPIGLRNNDNDDDAELHHQNGTGILDGNLSHESGQLQQRIEALQVIELLSLSLSLSLPLSLPLDRKCMT